MIQSLATSLVLLLSVCVLTLNVFLLVALSQRSDLLDVLFVKDTLQAREEETCATAPHTATIPSVDAFFPTTQRQDNLYFHGQVRRKSFMEKGMLLFNETRMEFLMVSDLDQNSRDPQDFLWKSYLKRGELIHHNNHTFSIDWVDTQTLYSRTARHNRSMELSELVRFNHRLLAMCDYTGLIFKIDGIGGDDEPKVYQRWAIADGDGEKVKPCKMEWATVKDGVLWVGSMGKEWNTADGTVLHRDAEWVKTIDDAGRVQNLNWGPVYQALRRATNTTAPGYLWHEAVHWDPRGRRWIFLPRKASTDTPYHPKTDELMGTNLLIVASEDFRDIQVTEIGPLAPELGFTAVRKVPGKESLFMALKVLENEHETKTWIMVFDLEGNMFLDPPLQKVADMVKFEGLEFM